MNYELDTGQRLLRDNLQNFLTEQYGFAARRSAVMGEAGWQAALWRRLADELGLLGAGLPEHVGGTGGGAVEHMIVMEAFGAALVVEPYLETCVLAGGLLARAKAANADALLAAICDGSAVFAFAWAEPQSRFRLQAAATCATSEADGWRLSGHKAVVIAAPWATHLLVSACVDSSEAPSLFVVERAARGLTLQSYPTFDGRRAADVHFDDVRLERDALIGEQGGALATIERALDEASVAVCAEAVGVMGFLQAQTLDYTRQRRQFGRALAEFQVLQHRMVDMYLQIELARAATVMATLSLDAAAGARALAVSTAKVTVAQACRFVGQNAVQLHGGIGMTDDLPLGSYFKRATAIEHEFGSVDRHLARHARLERAAG